MISTKVSISCRGGFDEYTVYCEYLCRISKIYGVSDDFCGVKNVPGITSFIRAAEPYDATYKAASITFNSARDKEAQDIGRFARSICGACAYRDKKSLVI